MTIPVVSLQHPSAGTSRSRRRARFIPASASAGTTSLISPRSGPRLPLAGPGPQSSAAFSSHQSPQNHPLPTPLRDQIPIDRPSCSPLSRGFVLRRLSDAGPRLDRVDCSRRAGIRNPNRFRTSLDTCPKWDRRAVCYRECPAEGASGMHLIASALVCAVLFTAIARAGTSANCGIPAAMSDGWPVSPPAAQGLDPQLISALPVQVLPS